MQKIKVAGVGIGHLGSIHAKLYQEIETCSLVGVCDIDKTRLDQTSKGLGVPGYLHYQELFDKVQAVSIASPTKLHYRIAEDFLRHNIHVLVEKPFTTDLKEADTLIKLARKNKLILQVGHVERFNSAFTATQKLLRQHK